ncbi:MAG TPA: DUF2092 domain-containing protein [Rhizomicrobium sp.]|nr:DUF2092 domain-containing protein [Rhizomicrobium sp.]
MKHRITTICAALLLAAAASAVAAGAPMGGGKPPAAPASAVDPEALAALDRMGAELRSHQNFDVKSDITTEDVLVSGQKLQYAGTLETLARRPNAFRISMVSDLRDRRIYYDGKAVTLFSPRLGFYASFPAPDTIGKTLARAKDRYGIELPLADLFAWGTDKSLAARVRSGFRVAAEHVGSQVCDHYAFRNERVDWQIWIAQSGPPLPCKLVITSRDDPSMPQYSAVLHWSFPASIPDSVFAFVPPPAAKKIVIATIGRMEGSRP